MKIKVVDKDGLYANINAKRNRIKKGSGERMKKPGQEGRPTKQDFENATKTVKKSKDTISLLRIMAEGVKQVKDLRIGHVYADDDNDPQRYRITEIYQSEDGLYTAKSDDLVLFKNKKGSDTVYVSIWAEAENRNNPNNRW
jgi:hypothetical protein